MTDRRKKKHKMRHFLRAKHVTAISMNLDKILIYIEQETQIIRNTSTSKHYVRTKESKPLLKKTFWLKSK